MVPHLGRAAPGRPCWGRTPGACATDDGWHAELDHGRTDTEKLRDTAKVVRSDRRRLFRITDRRARPATEVSLAAQRSGVHADRRRCTKMY